MGTIIVLTVLTGVVFFIVRGMVRDKKQGKSGCGGRLRQMRRVPLECNLW